MIIRPENIEDSLRKEIEFVLFDDWKEDKIKNIDTCEWIEVYRLEKNENEDIAIYCSVCSPDKIPHSMKYYSWDLCIGQGRPGVETSPDGRTCYFRYGCEEGFEPLVNVRDFHNIFPSNIEISEEFRYFHNLYYDLQKGNYIKLHDDGDTEDAIEVGTNSCKIKRHLLLEYLRARDVVLLMYFDNKRWLSKALDKLQMSEEDDYIRDSKTSLRICLRQDHRWHELSTIGILSGKRIVSSADVVSIQRSEDFPDFIIGRDSSGKEVYFSCNHDKLSNSFGSNPGAPNYLTQVFFTRDVLRKYLSDSEKYRVTDSFIQCGGLWSFQIDNNHKDYVIAFLGDLGQYLPERERIYWKGFNVAPDGEISEVTYKRSILGEFTDPTAPDLVFKQCFKEFENKWALMFGWFLFKPLHAADQHEFDTLTRLLVNDQKAFDEFVKAISKIIIDSINEGELAKQMKFDENDGGITKLGKYLEVKGFADHAKITKFLRSLWDLRHGSAHRKGDNYERGAEYFKLGKLDFTTVADNIFGMATKMLCYIQDHFIPPSGQAF